jgi:two-component system, cell cycle response regulator
MTQKGKTVVTIISKISERPLGQAGCLVVIYGADLGKKYPLDKPTTIIGRSSSCDIQVDQESVSRSHAKLINTGCAININDLGSTNGSYVNDEQVQKCELRDGDFVKIGRTIFKFLSGSNIENAYHEEIYRLTTVDGLTQVYNKRYFMENLDREISRSKRYGRDLSLVLYDIDHFKNINDTYGNLAGDYILKSMSTLVKSNIRREDFLARVGGEEFAAILPEIDHAKALLMAEKVRKLIEAYEFSFEPSKIRISVSIGVATLDDTTSEAADFLKKAEDCLLGAKKEGRNRVH